MLPRYIREMRRCNINASHEIFVAVLPFISLALRTLYRGCGRGRGREYGVPLGSERDGSWSRLSAGRETEAENRGGEREKRRGAGERGGTSAPRPTEGSPVSSALVSTISQRGFVLGASRLDDAAPRRSAPFLAAPGISLGNLHLRGISTVFRNLIIRPRSGGARGWSLDGRRIARPSALPFKTARKFPADLSAFGRMRFSPLSLPPKVRALLSDASRTVVARNIARRGGRSPRIRASCEAAGSSGGGNKRAARVGSIARGKRFDVPTIRVSRFGFVLGGD